MGKVRPSFFRLLNSFFLVVAILVVLDPLKSADVRADKAYQLPHVAELGSRSAGAEFQESNHYSQRQEDDTAAKLYLKYNLYLLFFPIIAVVFFPIALVLSPIAIPVLIYLLFCLPSDTSFKDCFAKAPSNSTSAMMIF